MFASLLFYVALVMSLASAQAGPSPKLAGTDILALHNGYRRVHQAPALTSSASVVSGAQSWANNLAATCTFKHSGASGVGENLAMGYRTWADVAFAWYNEQAQYRYSAPGYSSNTGHFTQMVWRDTKQLGCATAKSKCTSQTIYVCRYTPPGNWQGATNFRTNVLPPAS
ncbi:putative SCP-like extracellular protein [Haematococcus lacustris]